jgi:hypothetical protein
MVACFLDFHDIKESPRKTQYPVTERRESGHVAQSESLEALSCKDEEEGKNNP